MAKKKKKSGAKRRRYSSRRRRGIGSLGGFNLTAAVSALGGALAGRVVTQASKNVPIQDEKIKNIARFAVKGIGAYVLLTRPSAELQAAGYGMGGELALDIADSFFPNVFGGDAEKPTVTGIGATVIDLDNISGNEDYMVSGTDDDLMVAGVV